MNAKAIIAILLISMVMHGTLAASQLSYIEYKTNNMAQLEHKINRLQSLGLKVVHILPPNALFVKTYKNQLNNLRVDPDLNLCLVPNDREIKRTAAINIQAFQIWQRMIDRESHESDQEYDPERQLHLQDCIKKFNLAEIYDSVNMNAMSDDRLPLPLHHEMFTSNFMIGRIAVNLILMESEGDLENWTTYAEDKTIAELFEATDFLSEKAEENEVNLSWVYEIHKAVPTSYEPITMQSVPYNTGFPLFNWVFYWIDDALAYLGYEHDEWSGCFEMANDMRKRYYANWGFSIFVVMDENDANHMFDDGKFAYVPYLYWEQIVGEDGPTNACFVVCTYNNDGYTPGNMNYVFQHEFCHIFRAPDEYTSGCEDNDCTENYYGCLHVLNGNCERCNADPQECLMRGGVCDTYCDYTLQHLGWRDTDSDGPSDPIDQNNGGWMSVFDIERGDLIKIFTIQREFANLISVTSDNLFSTDTSNCVIWDGHNFDNQAAAQAQYYIVAINDGEEFVRDLHIGDPLASVPYFSDISYSNGKLIWKLNQSFAYIRCFIYDQSNVLVSRLIWDKA